MKNLEAISFIKEKLKELVVAFPMTRVRYEYDIDAEVHCVEVVPNNIYHSDNDYIDWENNFTNHFIQVFPFQNICVFSDDAIVGINNSNFERIGSNYFDLISTNEGKPHISLEQIPIFEPSIYLNLDLNLENISLIPNTRVLNNGIATQVSRGNIIPGKVNSPITPVENQDQALFPTNYLMAVA